MKRILLAVAGIASFTGLASAATLAPNDPSVSASLGLWLTDARNNFDGSTWIDEWFNTTTSLNSVLSNAGAQFTTSTDDFYLGDLRAGPTVIPGVAGASTTNSDFSISQVIVYNSALTDQQIADINEWMLSPIPEPGSCLLLGLASGCLLLRRRR